MDFWDVKDKIQKTDIGFLFRIEALAFSLTYQGVVQTASLAATKAFHFKISERAVFKEVALTFITISSEPQS